MKASVTISTFVVLSITVLVVSASFQSKTLTTRQRVDYGPTPAVNCTTQPTKCPKKGPSGTLNFPAGGDTLTTIWDNSGYVNVSYTPVKKHAPEGSVRTSSVIFTLRQYLIGVRRFDDKFIYLGARSVPADSDFSQPITFELAIPARFYDGDDSANDISLGNDQGGFYATYGFQVIEQQVFQPLNATAGQPAAYLIQFQSASPLVNVTYIKNPSLA